VSVVDTGEYVFFVICSGSIRRTTTDLTNLPGLLGLRLLLFEHHLIIDLVDELNLPPLLLRHVVDLLLHR
jgi:hypothetical protein